MAIILNGQREAMARLRRNWQDYQTIIVCDGAWKTAETLSRQLGSSICLSNPSNFEREQEGIEKGQLPQVIVLGDGDSLANKPPHFIQDDDQYSTDFEKALRYVILKEGVVNSLLFAIDIYWANGGNLDHTLGNMAMACKYNKQITCHFFTDTQYYRYVNSSLTILNAKDKTVSLFPFPQCTVKHSTGILYPMIDYSMTQHTQQSLRNEISEELAVIDFAVARDIDRKSSILKDFSDIDMGCFVFVAL